MVSAPIPYQYSARQSEVIAVYDLYRTALMWEHYYGKREAQYSRLNLGLQILAGLGSSATLAALLVVHAPGVWIIVTASAAVVSVVLPLFNMTDRVCTFHNLRFAYGSLSSRVQQLTQEIRSRGEFTSEHRALAASYSGELSALAPLGYGDPDKEFLEKLQEDVDRQVPPDRLWLPYE